MSKWLRHTIELIVACIVLIGFVAFYNIYQINQNGLPVHHHFRTSRQVANESSVPTLYFHGLQGSSLSTDHLIDTAARTDGQRAMVINVDRKGRLRCNGSINDQMYHPLVQVNFLDNVAPIKDQVKWTHQILMMLKAHYHINEYNAVAHNAGAVNVLETTNKFGYQRNVAHLKRFVSIAGPYDGVIGMNDRPNQNTLEKKDKPQIMKRGNHWYPSYWQLLKDSRHFPRNVEVLNIYGCINRRLNSDGTVTNVSSRSLGYLLHGRVTDYQTIPIYGRYGHNNLLHHNSVVDRIVNRFIFNE